MSSEVQEELVKGMFVKEHTERSFSFPDVEISFSLDSKQSTDFKYTASYYSSNTDPTVVDEYSSWYYFNSDNQVVRIESQN